MDIATIIEGIGVADVLISTLAGTTVVSELLPHVKKVEANSTLQLCFNILKVVLDAFRK